MADVIIDTKNYRPKRSDFLTGLCIFSFIICSWLLLCGVVQLSKAEAQEKAINKVKDLLSNDEFQRNATSTQADVIAIRMAERMASAFTTENLQLISIAGIITALLCGIGVGLMWNMKRNGIYFYLVGILVSIISLILLFGKAKIIAMGLLGLHGIITFFVLIGASNLLASILFALITSVWLFCTVMFWKESRKMNDIQV
ncbi:MAG: hypothetical protein V4556_09680 [Bacteroidota bacterium]